MDDRDIVTGIVAGEADGIASAYDKYAESLYGFCHSMAPEPTDAAVAVQDTFIIAAARLGALRDPRKLRPWLYAVARTQCRRTPYPSRPSPADPPPPEPHEPDEPDEQDADASPPDAAPPDTGPVGEDAELRRLADRVLSGLHPSEREVIELNLGHHLAGSDLAAVLGVSRSQAHALVARARGRLEKPLGAPLAARAGRQDCPVLDTLLADGAGRLTALTRKRIARHIGSCDTCAARVRADLDDVVRSTLEPPVAPPPALREEVLRLCSEQDPEAPEASVDQAYREWVIQRAGQFGPAGFPRPVRPPRRIFAVTGAAAAAGILVAAASTGIVTVLTLGGTHVPRSVDTARTGDGSAIATPGATGNVVATRSATVTHGTPGPGSAPANVFLSPIGPTASALAPPAGPNPSSPAPSRASAIPAPSGSARLTTSPSPSPSGSSAPAPIPTPPIPPASPGGQWPPPTSPPATGMP